METLRVGVDGYSALFDADHRLARPRGAVLPAVDEHDEMPRTFENAAQPSGLRRPPAPVAAKDDQRVRLERDRHRAFRIAADVHAERGAQPFGFQRPKEFFGRDR